MSLPGGFWNFLLSSRKGLAEIDRGFRVWSPSRCSAAAPAAGTAWPIINLTNGKKAVFERLGVRLPYVKAMSVSNSGTRKAETYRFTYMETYGETYGFTYDYV